MRTSPDRPPLSTPVLAQRSGFPARGIPISVAVHVFVFGALLLYREAPALRVANPGHRPPREIALTVPLESLQSPSAGKPGAPGIEGAKAASHSVASRSMPVTFVGPRQVISNTKDPDNSVQTILQPDVLAPRRLPYPIAVPSVVKLAMPQPSAMLPVSGVSSPAVVRAPPPPPIWKLPTAHSPVETTPVTAPDLLVATPKLPVLASPVSNYAPQPTPPPQPKPSPETAKTQTAAPVPPKLVPPKPSPATQAEQPRVVAQSPGAPAPAKAPAPSGSGRDDRNLLVVNAIETQSSANDELIAQSEIHGRFEIAPVTVPGMAKSSPGELKPDRKAGTGPGPASNGPNASSGSAGAGPSAGKESGSAPGGSATSSPAGGGRGTGRSGTASGAGEQGASASTSPFGAITIQGGTASGGRGGGSASGTGTIAHTQPVQHGSYGMTIVSSGSSGGGLRDFGTFRDGPVYTVYLDVSSLGIRGTRWSLQYGAAREARLAHPGALLTPPFPSHQVLPKFPAALVASNLTRLFVVQADISTDGALESIQILQSPDLTLNVLLKDCLLKWSFQSASMGADPVPVRVLIGIPIAAVMAQAPGATP